MFFRQILHLEFLPVFVLEVLIDAFDLVGPFTHTFVVAVVIDNELFSGQQLLENVPIRFEDVSDHPVSFFE